MAGTWQSIRGDEPLNFNLRHFLIETGGVVLDLSSCTCKFYSSNGTLAYHGLGLNPERHRWLDKTVQSRDFTEKDIIFLHPSTTPYPGGFKCFTCEDAPDNYECNRWAPDLYCPRESRYCYTTHKMSWDGNTLAVTKRCVALDDCLTTGCSDIDHEGNKVCTSCCEGNICNLPLPRNETDAIFATTSPLVRA